MNSSSRSQPGYGAPDGAAPETAALSGSGKIRHGRWTIYFDPPPIPVRDSDWAFSHDDFDASWEGEEDGWVTNGLSGRGSSVKDCIEQIEDIEADRGTS